MVVMHWFGIGTLSGADSRFKNSSSYVSAHYGVSDSTVYQWVKEEHVAWHAGNYPINQRSIGIEHDATTEHPASEQTYKTSAKLLKQICTRYNIPLDREHITGHNKHSATACPGTLDIDKIIKLAKEDIMDWLGEDIPTEVEDKFKLKDIKRYNKYWDFNELIEDWIKLTQELKDVKLELKEKVATLEEKLEASTRQYNMLEKEKNVLETNLEALEREIIDERKKYKLELSVLQQQVQDVGTQYDILLEKYDNLTEEMDEGYGEQISRLKATIKDLEERVARLQRPVPTISEAIILLGQSIKKGVWS